MARPKQVCRGEVTEWLKVHDWNSCVGQLTGGSNPPLSATSSIAAGEGRGPTTVSREPRQAGNGATVASDSGRRSPRLSPARWIPCTSKAARHLVVAAFVVSAAACSAKVPPEPVGPTDACPPGATLVDGPTEAACLLGGVRHGRAVRRDPSGRVVEEAMYRHGQRHGPYRRFGADGHLQVLGTYEEGLRDGEWQWWWPDGTPQTVGAYAAGDESGRWVSFWPGGWMQSEGEMVAGARQGAWRFWHHQRQLGAAGVYDDGMRVGGWTFLDPQGEPISATQYDERYAL